MNGIPWLFEAENNGGGKVVVKFVRFHYGEDVHRFLYSKGLAPELLICKCLAGGWYICCCYEKERESTVRTPCKRTCEEGARLCTWGSTFPKHHI